MLCAALLMWLAGPASAGTYTVSSCRAGDGTPLSSRAWRLNASVSDGITASDSCNSGGSLDLDWVTTQQTSASAYYSFDAPAGTSITSYTLASALSTAESDPGPTYRYRAFVREHAASGNLDIGCASDGNPCSSVGSMNSAGDPGNVMTVPAANLQSLQLWIACGLETCGPSLLDHAAHARLYRSQITLTDSNAPVVGAKSGSLLGPSPASGTALLRVATSDSGGGVASATASVDGAPPQTWTPLDDHCVQPFVDAQPCPPASEASFEFNTTKLTDDAHKVSGSVSDAAGNKTFFGPLYFTVSNAAGPTVATQASGNGTPAVTMPVLTFKAASLVRPRGTKTAATGLLSTQSGVPIAGATLVVRSVQLATDQLQEQPLPDVVTGKDGTFTVPVQSDGAQLLRVEFSPSAGAAVTASASVSVRTETDIQFKTSKSKLKRGRKVTLSGSLLGAGQSAHGTTASIQAVVRGKWRPVGAAEVSADGKFSWTYKFVALHRTTVFSFRAVVVRTPGWPWPTTVSNKLHVKVTL